MPMYNIRLSDAEILSAKASNPEEALIEFEKLSPLKEELEDKKMRLSLQNPNDEVSPYMMSERDDGHTPPEPKTPVYEIPL